MMAVTGDLVGTTAAQTMEFLEEEYDGHDAEVIHVAIVVAVKVHAPDPDDEGFSVVHVESSDKINFRVVGLLHRGLSALDDN